MSKQDWGTPPDIAEMIIDCMDVIDLDPCADSNPLLRTIPAKQCYDITTNGLDKPWQGRVFLNPPFSGTGQWVSKLQQEIWAGNTTEAILLCLASVETRWFQWLAAQPLCLPNKRINYMYETETGVLLQKKGFDRASCLFYFGPRPEKFAQVFGEPFGRIYRCQNHKS